MTTFAAAHPSLLTAMQLHVAPTHFRIQAIQRTVKRARVTIGPLANIALVQNWRVRLIGVASKFTREKFQHRNDG